eukprot:TRINITY_DN8620_c0_g1_i1.p1 TRINITY_DN8620_c0_g1~~TRINITY_DN8620_c0_g1_i1.p1  ORF type:complete len:844 (-),score=200.00 TRINITY_DN8620_c0_g1_i1:11-2542(-)
MYNDWKEKTSAKSERKELERTKYKINQLSEELENQKQIMHNMAQSLKKAKQENAKLRKEHGKTSSSSDRGVSRESRSRNSQQYTDVLAEPETRKEEHGTKSKKRSSKPRSSDVVEKILRKVRAKRGEESEPLPVFSRSSCQESPREAKPTEPEDLYTVTVRAEAWDNDTAPAPFLIGKQGKTTPATPRSKREQEELMQNLMRLAEENDRLQETVQQYTHAEARWKLQHEEDALLLTEMNNALYEMRATMEHERITALNTVHGGAVTPLSSELSALLQPRRVSFSASSPAPSPLMPISPYASPAGDRQAQPLGASFIEELAQLEHDQQEELQLLQTPQHQQPQPHTPQPQIPQPQILQIPPQTPQTPQPQTPQPQTPQQQIQPLTPQPQPQTPPSQIPQLQPQTPKSENTEQLPGIVHVRTPVPPLPLGGRKSPRVLSAFLNDNTPKPKSKPSTPSCEEVRLLFSPQKARRGRKDSLKDSLTDPPTTTTPRLIVEPPETAIVETKSDGLQAIDGQKDSQLYIFTEELATKIRERIAAIDDSKKELYEDIQGCVRLFLQERESEMKDTLSGDALTTLPSVLMLFGMFVVGRDDENAAEDEQQQMTTTLGGSNKGKSGEWCIVDKEKTETPRHRLRSRSLKGIADKKREGQSPVSAMQLWTKYVDVDKDMLERERERIRAKCRARRTKSLIGEHDVLLNNLEKKAMTKSDPTSSAELSKHTTECDDGPRAQLMRVMEKDVEAAKAELKQVRKENKRLKTELRVKNRQSELQGHHLPPAEVVTVGSTSEEWLQLTREVEALRQQLAAATTTTTLGDREVLGGHDGASFVNQWMAAMWQATPWNWNDF